MSLADSIRKKKTRPAAGADPARAFGAEELTMEEIQRQNFVPPREKLSGITRRAGTALGNLRQKIVGEEPAEEAFPGYQEPASVPRKEAPIYTSRTFQNESAPDLGWDNPFTDPSPRKKAPVRSAPPRSDPSPRQNPRYTAYPEEPYGYAQQPYSTPRPNRSFAQTPSYSAAPASGYAPAQDVRSADFYPQEEYYSSGAAPLSGYAPQVGYAPQNGYSPASNVEDLPPYPDPYEYDPNVQEYGETWGGRRRLPVRRSAPRKAEIGDFKYVFWSVSIVVSILLTLTAFIYGCTV